VPVQGGAEKPVLPSIRPSTWASWSVVDRGILFAGSSGKGGPALSLYDSATHRLTKVGVLDTVPFWLSTTHDGKTAVFDKPGWEQAQVMLIENYR
jgi:hypothetical protein